MTFERSGHVRGLTVIEVLVSLALLSIISTAIIASFAATGRLNRDAATDVDYSRVVRSAMERVGVVWSDPERWVSENAGDFADAAAINAFVAGLSPDCRAEILAPSDAEALAVVRVLVITCGGGDTGLGEQVFAQEFGAP